MKQFNFLILWYDEQRGKTKYTACEKSMAIYFVENIVEHKVELWDTDMLDIIYVHSIDRFVFLTKQIAAS